MRTLCRHPKLTVIQRDNFDVCATLEHQLCYVINYLNKLRIVKLVKLVKNNVK